MKPSGNLLSNTNNKELNIIENARPVLSKNYSLPKKEDYLSYTMPRNIRNTVPILKGRELRLGTGIEVEIEIESESEFEFEFEGKIAFEIK